MQDGIQLDPHARQWSSPTAGNTGDMVAVHETLGWTDCGHDNWRPGNILDPFAGSGTTLEAAVALGYTAVGIDLDPRNLDLARQRVGMFLEVAS
jgi:predicted RNA methylase